MSSYLEDPDTDSDAEVICTLTEEEKEAISSQCLILKQEGNALFSSKDYEGALVKYTVRLFHTLSLIHHFLFLPQFKPLIISLSSLFSLISLFSSYFLGNY